MIGRTKKEETLSDKIAGLLSTAPESFDPEDDIYEETRAQVNKQLQDNDAEELYSSNFRKQNIDLLEDVDKRYVGKKGSRKSLKDSDDDWETEDVGLSTDEGEALDGISGTQKVLSSGEESDNDDEGDESYNEEDESNIEFSDEDNLKDGKDNSKNFKHMSDMSMSSQVKKGTCVRNQLNIWESLLEIRIQLQKCLITSNKMPQYDVVDNFSDENLKSETAKTKRSVRHILDKFLTLQELLLKQFSETKNLLKESKNKKEKKEESDEEIPSDTDDEVKSEVEDESDEEIPKKRKKISDFEQEIKNRHEKYKDFRNSVIQKWNEKTRLAVGKNNSGSSSLLQHINFLLEDKQKLVKRTQLKRSEYEILGKIKPEIQTEQEEEQRHESKLPDEYDTEIFDDDDFYHQLLRELIEFKSAGITDPVQMSRQWIQLQNMRSKMKRKIDTRATKGRKIRYAVHSKLVNFMAPIDTNSLTEEAKNELFSSLFGKNQPKNV